MIGRNRDKVHRLASELSGTCYAVDESRRAVLHLAAVFACNFGNAMNHIADDILKAEGMDLKMLLPLLQESLRKLQTLSPAEAQTGPAARGDRLVMEKHLSMLEDDRVKRIYREVSRYIEDHD